MPAQLDLASRSWLRRIRRVVGYNPTLSESERRELHAQERLIDRGLRTFYEVGTALKTIRDKRLYRDTHSTFEAYLHERWDLGRAHAYRLMGAADVFRNLSPNGDTPSVLPTAESQLRPLVPLERGEQRRAWRNAVDAADGDAVTAAQVERAVALLREKARKTLIAAGREARKEVEHERRQERLKRAVRRSASQEGQPQLGELRRRYLVIYADPPWQYQRKISGSRDVENHYPTMTLDEICALPVGDIVAEDAILFLWTTSSHLQEAFQVCARWGFEYRTQAVWVKTQGVGQGHYFRQQHEVLLVGVRNAFPTPDPSHRVSSVISAPRRKHSQKPTVVYDIIERMYPDVPRIELFARAEREGWDCWGNEVAAIGGEV